MDFLRWYRQHWDRSDTALAIALVLAITFRLAVFILK